MTFTKDPRENWQPPDGLGYSSLRPVELTRHGYALVVLAVAILVGTAVLGAYVGRKGEDRATKHRLLREQGLETTASVSRVWRDGGEERERMVTYRFTAAGREIEGKSGAPAKIWEGLAPGATLPIRFLPADPRINHPAGWEQSDMPPWVPYFISSMGLFLAVAFTVLIRKQMRLLSEGRAAPGVVTAVRRSDKGTFVRYEFTLLSGAVVKGRSSTGRRPPGIGAQITVLYDPEKPRRNALYPMPLVRLQRS